MSAGELVDRDALRCPGNRFIEFSKAQTEQSVAQRFEKQVRKHPQSIAVQTERVQLTYNDLNQSANRLARLILQQSRDERPVAILMEHDAPAVVALLGALKASKIFLLLDPALPDTRIEQTLDDAGSNLIVTNDQNLGIAKDLLKRDQRLLNLNCCDSVSDASNLDIPNPPDSVSHILYTSGSTGKPKGVMRTHRNDLQNIRNRTNSFCIGGDDRITLLGSFSTGQGMTDIYAALLNGATLFPRNLKREGLLGLAEWLMQERITIFHSSATFFRHFVGELNSDVIFSGVRIVNVGGEPVTWKDVDLYRVHFPDDCVLVNELSCSEASTFAQFFVNKKTAINLTVPVGYPVEGKDVLILDDMGNTLSTGEGEIAICSQFLSPGYWNQPELTELVFSPHPEFQEQRIYRTGDLGRKAADGCLEYLGRKDTRVKIRGYRVECYEIELALLQNSSVNQAFVTHRPDSRNETYLVAYVVSAKGATPNISNLRADLSRRLPNYMVPAAFVFLDNLPLTPTGKIDRRALPEPDLTRSLLETSYVAPRGPIEKSVADISSEILNISLIGVHDNLFDLGGHSLSAMQIVARVMKTFRVNVPLRRFYESPTIGGLSAIIAARNDSATASEDTEPRQELQKGHFPLSYSQERLWFMEQLDVAKPTYNLCQAHRLEGPLNAHSLEESLNLVVARHEILRTSFGAEKGQPFQIIAPVLRVPLPIVDLSAKPTAERDSASLELAQAVARQPFDLSQSPLLRTLLVKTSDEEHLLVLSMHQMVCDGWSARILLSELWVSYEAVQRGESSSLPALLAQYSDFAIWQRRLLDEEWLQPQIVFWQKTLEGDLPILRLPTDYPRPVVESFRGSRVSFVLSESVTKSLNELARQQGVTLFMTLLAAFKMLLYRYTRQEDSIVGFPVANRHWSEAMGLIGFFINTLVARTSISAGLTFRDFLYSVRHVCQAAYAHQDLPFEKLVEIVRPPRDLSRSPVTQAMFTFHNMPSGYTVPPQLRSTLISIDNGTSKVDLTLSLAERENQLTGFFEYSIDLFKHDRIERMVGHFQTLVEAIVKDPDQPIGTLPILTESERHKILVEWNDTAADYPKDKCIHQLFEEQVERTPEAIAAEFEDQRITYRELNRRANQLAHYLVGLGIGPEKLVGINVERSIEMVVGLLGILKAGGAYVPLDPAYPEERLRFMLQDAQVSVLLTQEDSIEDRRLSIEDRDPSSSTLDPRLTVVCLDRDWPVIAQQKDYNSETAVKSDNLAYVIYTSGSTGKPKGVQIEHRSVVNCLNSVADRLGFNEHDVLLAVTTIAFDISALELFLPLFIGGKVVVTSRYQAADGSELGRLLANSRVTALQATPSTWRLLIEAGWEGLPGFKILCGGEAISRDLAEALLTRGEVWNLYGPTESTIWSTIHHVETSEGPVLIGRPIANTKIYILDSHLQPVPIGVHGDLYIGGDGLARGYWNNSELTTERFIPDPFSDDAVAWVYRTGDRVRYRPDGNIEFLGRTDSQVKIRGHRIELGEIESVLTQHPAVKESVIVSRERDSSGEKELVTYVVSQDKPEPTTNELRHFLHSKLPDYMVPFFFVFLDALPLTSNGKLDHSALPPSNGERPAHTQGFVEPCTEIEELVAQVWREVLKRETVGIYDNFFDLGGHSLLATRVVARLRTGFNIDLPLRKLFELPTVAGLVEHIEILRRSENVVSIPPILPVPRDREIPLSFSQQRLWFLRQLDPGATAYNMLSIFAIHGPLSVPVLERAINAVIVRHEILRTVFPEKDGKPVQVILPFLEITVPVIDLGDTAEPAREPKAHELTLTEARQPFDLRAGPLLRAKILALAEQDFYFLLNVDHMILDATSMAVFFKEIAACYEAILDGRVCALAPPAVQYADYAVWQREDIPDESLNAQLEYWKRQFDSWPPQAELPADHGRPPVQTWRGARLTKNLSRELTTGLKVLSRREGVTLFMTLLAAFDIIVARHTGSEVIVVGSTIAGRGRPEIENLIGFFINALPLRVDLAGNPTFTALLKRVREVCLDAYTHQELPFERIVEAINPQRDLSRNPLFQILFNLADSSDRVLRLRGCEVTRQSFFDREAKFDLTLYAPEKDGAIELAIVYNTDLFSAERMAPMLDQYAHLLAQIATEPEKAIGEYDLVAPEGRSIPPDPAAPLDSGWVGAIDELFSRHAENSPARLAVSDGLGNWTYGELERASNQLANYLLARGIKTKDGVAIYAQRGASLVAALLGVLKAGGVFTILDPAYPAARLLSYLRIARPKGWLQITGSDELPEELSRDLETLAFECRLVLPTNKTEFAEMLRDVSQAKPPFAIAANDPAYIAFTSGSTGEAKGVLCRHGSITHFLPWQTNAFGLSGNDRFALLSGLAYNHLHRDVFTALAMGAAVYIPPPEIAREPVQLCNWLRENSITVLHLTPALGQLLLTGGEKTLPAVRRVFFGGDVLPQGQVTNIRAMAPNATIGCFYGATETQRAVGYYEIPADFVAKDLDVNRPIPLGRGIEDVQLLLLNKNGKLAGIGELGELYVRSPHLAEGYVGDETLTRERFVTNPFISDPEDRLYRTGEMGRYLRDGNVEWAGRNDRRVNIRGFRVELDEIEMVLRQHPTIKDAAVVLREFHLPNAEIPLVGHYDNLKSKIQNPKSDRQLVAYIISTEENSQSLRDLFHSYVSSRLPDYMVPAHFVILEQLPLSPNGKVDYRALPPVRQIQTGSSSPIINPRNEVEAVISAIFCQVLARDQVGIEENFFRLGGHSLLAAQAAARIREAYGLNFELRTFLESPTVAALAKHIAIRIKAADTAPITDDTNREEIEL